MKHLFIFSTLVIMVVIQFSGCGKAKERPAVVQNEIADKVFPISKITEESQSQEGFSEENIKLKNKLIAKLDSEEKQNYATHLMSLNKLGLIFLDNKVSLVEYTSEKRSDFEVLSEFPAKFGVLENELTDYNEKKSVLIFKETNSETAEVIFID